MADKTEMLRALSIDRGEGPSHADRAGAPLWLLGVLAAVALVLVAAVVWLALRDRDAAAPAAPQEQGGEEQARAGGTDAAQGGAPSAPQAAAPARARAAGRLVASGYVVARRQATVSSDITGRILEVLVEEGATVEQGEILARLDDARAVIARDLARARLEAARADVDIIAAELAEARRVLARARSLTERNAASEARLTEAQAGVDSLAAQLRRAEAEAEAAAFDVAREVDLVERHLVRAPFSGVVIDKNAQAGEIVSPTSAGGGFTRTGIYTLVDMSSLEIEVDVNESSIDRIAAGQQAEAILDAYPDWRAPARVEAIIPTADRSRATIQVRVRFEALDPRILPDMAAKVTFFEDAE